jgi:hypothetical protein
MGKLWRDQPGEEHVQTRGQPERTSETSGKKPSADIDDACTHRCQDFGIVRVWSFGGTAMRQRLFDPVPASEITPESVYLDRRQVLQGLGAGLVAGLVGCDGRAEAGDSAASATMPAAIPNLETWAGSSKETKTTYRDVTGYNNFYEFGTGKGDPALRSGRFKPKPWTVEVSGEAEVTGRFDLDDLLKGIALEERIYRLRCVEAWSMVVPWNGFPLATLLNRFKPTSKAKYVVSRPSSIPAEDAGTAQRHVIDWPYRKACASTRRCIRSPCSRSASTAAGCRTRTARRCGSWCPGNTASRASSRSCASVSPRRSRTPAGATWHRTNTASTPT